MDAKKIATALVESTETLFAGFKKLELELDNLQTGPLSANEDILAAVEAVRTELGIKPGDKPKVGTWPIDGPGSDKCHWCTAGGGR